MDEMDRRKFLKVVGVGSGAMAAGALIPTMGSLTAKGSGAYAFRAVAGLPTGPIPAYASYVLEGSVNLTTRSGVLTKAVYAGGPEAMSTIALPGLSRVVRVTDIRHRGDLVYVDGVIDDPSQLLAGESLDVRLQIDRTANVAKARFLGTDVVLRLQT